MTLPGVTWAEVARVQPENLLEMVDDGASGSISIRTISARTSYAAGFATIGGGSRVDASRFAVAPPTLGAGRLFVTEERLVPSEHLEEANADAGYGAVAGALARALDEIPVIAVGNSDTSDPPAAPSGLGRWALLAAMDPGGYVDLAAVGPSLLERDLSAPYGLRSDPEALETAVDRSLESDCAVTIIDPGDLTRADEFAVTTGEDQPDARAEALLAADRLLGHIVEGLDFQRDLLLVASPTSPWWDEVVHLGVAVARGPEFGSGAALQSASTRREGVVTLPDVAPTVLEHLGISRAEGMTGRAWFSTGSSSGLPESAIDMDQESSFIESKKTPVTAGFVAAQVLVYGLAILLFARRSPVPRFPPAVRTAETVALLIVGFPVATYLAGVSQQHDLGTWGYVGVLVGIDVVIVTALTILLARRLDRFLALTALTTAVIFVDLLLGAQLQLNTVFGYSPVVAGRFYGLGNIGFAVLGISSLVTGALIAQRMESFRLGLVLAGALFAAAVVFDGAPQLGSDVGGVIALIPSLGVTWLLLSGRRPSAKSFALSVVAVVGILALFLALDLARPSEDRTHLARFYEDVRDRGFDVVVDTVERKIEANIRLFRSTIWTYFVPPALLTVGVLMLRPRGRWQRLSEVYPRIRAGLLGGLLLAVIGFAVNDSGIVIPAVCLTYLVPLSMTVHTELYRRESITGASNGAGGVPE